MVLSFFSMYSCNPDMDSVTAGTIKDRYCAANQEGLEMFDVDETESIKQCFREGSGHFRLQISTFIELKKWDVGCRYLEYCEIIWSLQG